MTNNTTTFHHEIYMSSNWMDAVTIQTSVIQAGPITTTTITSPVYTTTSWVIGPPKPDLSLVSSEDLMKEVLRRGAFKTIKEYRDKK